MEHMLPARAVKSSNLLHAGQDRRQNVSVYESAKAGVIAFHQGLAYEVASLGINVTAWPRVSDMTDLMVNVPPVILDGMLKPFH
jgi:NAD(P)-dependent dehydrogenase (short-subunit alcohol dehydrogenase family)